MKLTGLVVGLLLVLFTTSSLASAQNTQNFTINSFNSRYVLSKNSANVSQLQANEYINVQFPNFNQNHGILRAIPQSYNSESLSLRVLGVNKQSDEYAPSAGIWLYTSSTDNDNLVLKIGDPNQYALGAQSFHISYTAQNVTRAYDGYDEFYWNVNGTEWQQSITSTKAVLELPADISSALEPSKPPVCFTGVTGSTAQDCTITQNIDTAGATIITIVSNAPLSAGQNLSFAVAFKPGTFTAPVPTFLERVQPIIIGLLIIGLPLATLVFTISKWRKLGKDPSGRGTIVAEYQPPKESTLLMHEFVLRESGRPLAVTAQLIQLAIRGYIRIIDTEKDGLLSKKHDFSLQLIKQAEGASEIEKKTLALIFEPTDAPDTTVKLSSLATKLSSKVATLWGDVSTEAVTENYFTATPRKVITKYIALGSAICALGFASLFFGGWFGTSLGIAIIVSGIIIIVSAKFMPARTAKGVTLREYLLGLKLYIKMAEQDRIKFHQSPDTAERKQIDTNDNSQMVKLFEDLLPYAMLFGQEKEWGKQFANIYTTPPNWYGGNINTFSTGYLLGGLSGFDSAAATSFSPPASSGGSGFSGGSSGGGGGGGGGGGW